MTHGDELATLGVPRIRNLPNPRAATMNADHTILFGRVCATGVIVLTGATALLFAIDRLSRAADLAWLRAVIDAPLAIALWSYTVVTPLMAAAAQWLLTSPARLQRIVRVFTALWLLWAVGLSFIVSVM